VPYQTSWLISKHTCFICGRSEVQMLFQRSDILRHFMIFLSPSGKLQVSTSNWPWPLTSIFFLVG